MLIEEDKKVHEDICKQKLQTGKTFVAKTKKNVKHKNN